MWMYFAFPVGFILLIALMFDKKHKIKKIQDYRKINGDKLNKIRHEANNKTFF